jgi:hypothetical protein
MSTAIVFYELWSSILRAVVLHKQLCADWMDSGWDLTTENGVHTRTKRMPHTPFYDNEIGLHNARCVSHCFLARESAVQLTEGEEFLKKETEGEELAAACPIGSYEMYGNGQTWTVCRCNW